MSAHQTADLGTDRPRRVLQVVHQFLPRYVGGVELYTARLARGLAARSHSVAILTGGDVAGESEWDGLPVTTVPGGLRGPRGALALFRAAFTNREAEAAFTRLLDEFRPDVVHIQHLLGLSPRLPALAAARGVPAVLTLHDYWFECANTQLLTEDGALCNGPVAGVNCAACGLRRLHAPTPLVTAAPLLAPLFLARQRRVQAGLRHASLVIAPSEFIAGRAAAAGLDSKRLRLLRFGIPDEIATVRTTRPTTQENGGLRLAYVGSIAPRKGVHILIEALRQLGRQYLSLTVCGPLDEFPDYVAQLRHVAGGDPRVTFIGRQDAAGVAGVLSEADVLVAPSVWYENAPLVIAEAYAAGLPVVASRAGALAELVTDGVDGLHFRMGDAEDLARVLTRLAQDPALLSRLRAGVRPPPTMDRHLDALLNLYREAMAARTSSAPMA